MVRTSPFHGGNTGSNPVKGKTTKKHNINCLIIKKFKFIILTNLKTRVKYVLTICELDFIHIKYINETNNLLFHIV